VTSPTDTATDQTACVGQSAIAISDPATSDDEPASGAAKLLAALRGDVEKRPLVDPGLGGGLREWLEDGVAEGVALLPEHPAVLYVNKRTLADALADRLESGGSGGAITHQMARGALVDALFRQLVTTGTIEDPMDDALAALEVDDPDAAIAVFVHDLAAQDYAELAEEVAWHATSIQASWPPLAAHWLPRTQERLTTSLGGGRIVLTGLPDLVVGAPSSGRASVCLVELKTGGALVEHRADLFFYALLETIRNGAPPFRVATYYSGTGELDVAEVTEELLGAAVRRTIDATNVICRWKRDAAEREGA
jgi:hypothetical protein